MRGDILDGGWDDTIRQSLIGLARVGLSFGMGVLVLRLSRKTARFGLRNPSNIFFAAAIPTVFYALLQTPFAWMRTPIVHLLTLLILFPALVYIGAFVTLSKSWNALCTFLGDISYPIYLIHPFFIGLLYQDRVRNYVAAHPLPAHFIVPVTLSLCVAVSYLLFHLYDQPVRIWLTRQYKAASANRQVLKGQRPASY